MSSASAVRGFAGIAYNQATASENQIHSDDVARQYGFRGGLVPGVTTYAYLVQPAIVAWGLRWLERGSASVVLEKPLYEDAKFEVTAKADGPNAYTGEVRDSGEIVCARGEVALPADASPPPVRRGDPPAPAPAARPEATRATLEALRLGGLGSLHVAWQGEGSNDRYTRELTAMPDLVRPDEGGFANPAYTLGLANSVLSTNVRLGPWIHVQSELRHFAAIPLGSDLAVEAQVLDLFERGGHEFVELDVAVFIEPERPALRVLHRAIYRLRPPRQA